MPDAAPQYSITPRRAANARPLEIDAWGVFTLTEAAQFALAILEAVQTYGRVEVAPK